MTGEGRPGTRTHARMHIRTHARADGEHTPACAAIHIEEGAAGGADPPPPFFRFPLTYTHPPPAHIHNTAAVAATISLSFPAPRPRPEGKKKSTPIGDQAVPNADRGRVMLTRSLEHLQCTRVL